MERKPIDVIWSIELHVCAIMTTSSAALSRNRRRGKQQSWIDITHPFLDRIVDLGMSLNDASKETVAPHSDRAVQC